MALLRDMIDKFTKKETSDEEELPVEEEMVEKIFVRVDNLGGIVDIDRLMKHLKAGNILFLKTKELQRRDLGQFQNAVHKLKRVSQQYGWDLAGTEDGYIVVTPRFAQIIRD